MQQTAYIIKTSKMDHTVYFDMLSRCVLVLVFTGTVIFSGFLWLSPKRNSKVE